MIILKMNTKKHAIYGIIFSIACLVFFNIIDINRALIIWVSSWMVMDMDHTFRHILRTGTMNPIQLSKVNNKRSDYWKNALREEKGKYKYPIRFLHGIELIIPLIILSFFWTIGVFILIGFLFHLMLDFIDLRRRKEPIIIKLSIIGTMIYNRGRERFNCR